MTLLLPLPLPPLLLLLLPLLASAASPLAHCECRCCHHTPSFRTECAANITSVPLPHGHTCDTVLSSRDLTTCGPALCRAHAPPCPPPAFFKHACVSDRGFAGEWLPLLFAFTALIVLAGLVATHVHHRRTFLPLPQDAVPLDAPYKRDPLPPIQAVDYVQRPLLAKEGRVHTDDGASVEVVNVGPSSPLARPRRSQSMDSGVLSGEQLPLLGVASRGVRSARERHAPNWSTGDMNSII